MRRTLYLSFTYWLLFQAYGSAQLLQSSLNGTGGLTCLSLLYGVFSVASLFAPQMIGLVGPKALIPLSASLYVLMVGANASPSLETLLPACVGVGLGASTLWSSQGMLTGKWAQLHAQATGTALTDANSKMSGAFYSVFSSAGGFSAIIASLVIMWSDNPRQLFVYLAMVGTLAVLLMLLVPGPEDASERVLLSPVTVLKAARERWSSATGGRKGAARLEEEGEGGAVPGIAASATAASSTSTAKEAGAAAAAPAPRPSLLFMLRFLCKERRMRWFTPILLTTGMASGIFNGPFLGSVASRGYGLRIVGFMGATFSFGSAISTALWARMAAKPWWGRRWTFFVAILCQLSFLLVCVIWTLSFPGKGTAAGGAGPAEGGPPDSYLPILFFLSLLYSIGDSVCYAYAPATLQTFFPTGPEAACAMASIRFYNAIGFSAATFLSTLLMSEGQSFLPLQFGLLAVWVSISGLCLLHLNKNICPIDLRQSMEEIAAAEAAKRGGEGAGGGEKEEADAEVAVEGKVQQQLQLSQEAAGQVVDALQRGADSSTSSSSSSGSEWRATGSGALPLTAVVIATQSSAAGATFFPEASSDMVRATANPISEEGSAGGSAEEAGGGGGEGLPPQHGTRFRRLTNEI